MTDFDPTSALTDTEKAAIANERVRAWAADAYGHLLNKEAVKAADPDADTTDIDTALRIAGTIGSQTDLPASVAVGSIGNTAIRPFFWLKP